MEVSALLGQERLETERLYCAISIVTRCSSVPAGWLGPP